MNSPELTVKAVRPKQVTARGYEDVRRRSIFGKIVWAGALEDPSLVRQRFSLSGVHGPHGTRWISKRRGHMLLCEDGVLLVLLEVRRRAKES